MKKMITYAQNFEDILLRRAFENITDGFYVDVGAHDPIIGSITKYFYNLGWRGINIEPGPRFSALVKGRAEDTNLNVAVGAKGEIKFYEISSGLSTSHSNIAKSHIDLGYDVHEKIVQTVPLSEILSEIDNVIHFMKIDTEGDERKVLETLDFEKNRPWILVIESVHPLQEIQNHDNWEFLVINNKYRFVWFDGLNRWYISEEKYELLHHFFITPVNYFDNFITYKEYLFLHNFEQVNKLSSKDFIKNNRIVNLGV
jgi:FkbM family methyltransferase